MKTNKLLFAAIALMALVACSSDDKDDIEQRVPVRLTYNNVDAAETRAATNLNQGTFATGESVMVRISNTSADTWTDYTFTTGDAGAMTAPDPAPYYPAGSQNIDIVAYYPATAGETFTVAADQTADADYKASDLMFASVTNQAKQAEAVNLAFSHKMAKLCVNVAAGQGVGSITSVSIMNVKPTVTFNQATGAVGEATGTATTIAMSNQGAAVIPAQTINGNLLSIVTDKGTATYSVSNKSFAAGRLYTLNITVNLRAVGTTTNITDWISEGTLNITPGDWTVSVSGTYTYNGSAIVPDAGNITVHSTKANADIDPANYGVYVSNNVNAGEATLIVYGTGSYTGEFAYCTYTIGKAAGSIGYAVTDVGKFIIDVNFTNPLTFDGDGTVSYTSSNPSVASVNATTGEVHILTVGTTTITATAADGNNYAYATPTASYTLTVEANPASLSTLKSAVNSGKDCSCFFGFEVYDNGNLAPKGTGSGTVIGYVAYIKTDGDVDEYLSGSRILVIASHDAHTAVKWAEDKSVVTVLISTTALNGYGNTQELATRGDYPAAKAAWGYLSKNGSAVLTGSTGWFLPCYKQMYLLFNDGIGHGSRETLYANTDMLWSSVYWTSTEGGLNGNMAYVLGNDLIGLYDKDDEMSVRACFAY